MRAVLLACLLLALPAQAQQVCRPFEQLRRDWFRAYQERVVSVGLIRDGNALVIFAAPGGNWTAMIAQPNGIACVVADGYGYTEQPRGRDL